MSENEVGMIHGCPGAGKTKTILDKLEQHVEEDDLGLFDTFLANFTNNGREATADDLIERGIFDLSDYDDVDESDIRRRCRTLHSIALSICPEVPEPKEQVVSMDDDPEYYEGFCRENGLAFQADTTNPLELIQSGTEETPRGNKLFALDQWLHAKYHPSTDRLSKIASAPVDIELSNQQVRTLLKEWERYKQGGEGRGRRFEHHDYVDICLEKGYTPDVDFFAVDEFQDLSPVEYALYKLWRDEGDIKWIYIAGDVNQSIYSFRCASSIYLSETDVDERRYLTDSYRCPTEVSSVARGILESEPSITRNVFRTAERGDGYVPEGRAEMRSLTDAEALADAVRSALANHEQPGDEKATVYLLTRTNYQLGVVATALQKHGVPFDAIGDKMTPWPEHVVDCLLALRAVDQGRPAAQEPVETLLDVAKQTEKRKELFEDSDYERDFRVDTIESDAVYFSEKIQAAFPGRPAEDIPDVLNLTDNQKNMLRGALDSNMAPYPEQVQVGTIHEAKGLQAPCVFLFAETTNNIVDRYQQGEGRAEEHRVFYVGATRASESLYVVDNFFDGPTHPVFSDGLPGLDAGETPDSQGTGEAAD